MHYSENEEAKVDSTRSANTQLVGEGEAWPALGAFLLNGAIQLDVTKLGLELIPQHGSDSRFIHCAFCEVVMAVTLRRMRDKATVCKGMSYGWIPTVLPARPVCNKTTCLEFAELSQVMDCGKLVHLVDWAGGGVGGYKIVGIPKKAARRGRQRRQM